MLRGSKPIVANLQKWAWQELFELYLVQLIFYYVFADSFVYFKCTGSYYIFCNGKMAYLDKAQLENFLACFKTDDVKTTPHAVNGSLAF